MTLKKNIQFHRNLLIGIFLFSWTTYFCQEIKITPLKIGSSKESVFASCYSDGFLYFCSDKIVKTKNAIQVNGDINTNYLNLFQIKVAVGSNPSQKPILLSDSINSSLNEGPMIFSSDKKKVYFSTNIFNNKYDSTLRLGMFSASYDQSNFSNKTAIPELKIEKANVAHPALYQNDNMLIFVSDQDGGIGKSDLYYSFNQNGQWSAPINLSELNSESNETFPTVFNDKLYFSSDRSGGKGGLDLYVTTFINGNWLKPELLPSPINSEFDDFLFIPVDGKRGYLSSNRLNDMDKIFYFQYEIPSIENYLPQDLDTCFTFQDEDREYRKELEYTWQISDGATYEGDVVSHCFSKLGTFKINCTILETKMDSLHKIVDEIELTLTYSKPLIRMSELSDCIKLTCDQQYSPIQYKNYYWKVNGINYFERQPQIQKTKEMDVKLILWNDKEGIGIQKNYIFN